VFLNGGDADNNNNVDSTDTAAEQDDDEDDLYTYLPPATGKPALIDTMVRIPVDLDGTISQDRDAANTSDSVS
jgi:DASH complex subunit DAD2